MADTYRVLVTGSRDWNDARILHSALAAIRHWPRTLVIVHGAARGADEMAAQWAYAHGIGGGVTEEPHPADWVRYGKSAGPRRNAEMVALGADVCLAFYKRGAANRGTDHCARLAEAAGIPVRRFTA